MSIHWSFIDPYSGGLYGNTILEKKTNYWIDYDFNLVRQSLGEKSIFLGRFTQIEYAMRAAEEDLIQRHLELTDHNLQD